MGRDMPLLEASRDARPDSRERAAEVSPGRRMLPFFLFAAACYLAAPYVGLGSRDVDPRIAEVWPPGGVGFVLLTTVWYAGRRAVLATFAFMLVTFVVTAMLMGSHPGIAVWMGLLAVAQAAMMVWLYRRELSNPGWVPETPRDVAVLLFSAAASSLLIGLAGGFPLLSASESL